MRLSIQSSDASSPGIAQAETSAPRSENSFAAAYPKNPVPPKIITFCGFTSLL